MRFFGAIALAAGFLTLTGCASGTFQARQAEREKVSASSGLFCEFVNGEQHTDVDVELNMQMAKRCDTSRDFTVTNYRTSSEMNGLVYCCHSLAGQKQARARAVRSAPRLPAAAVEPKAESKPDIDFTSEGLPE